MGLFDKKEKGLKIIIVGCGKVGTTIVERLSGEGHDISVIDQDAERVAAVTGAYDVFGIIGNGATFNTLTEAEVDKADVFIAVTESDELNLLCCLIAKKAGNCQVIARVRTPDYSEEASYLQEKLGLAKIINPDLESANEIARILYIPTALSIKSFAGGKAEMVSIKLSENNVLVGKKIMEMSDILSGQVLICAVERGNEIYIPSGLSVMEAGDKITFIAPSRDGLSFLKKIGYSTKQVKNTMIIGGGRSGYYLAKQLISEGIDVKIIEQNKARCEVLSELLPKAIIINADGTDADILKETGIDNAESIVALTSIDEENIILALHAQEVSDAKVVTKCSRNTLDGVMSKLEIGSVVYPKFITSDAIVAYVRSLVASQNSEIKNFSKMFNNRVEAIEFEVKENSRVTDIPLMELKTKDNLLITCINRQGQILIPSGRDCIKQGDSIIVVTTHTGFDDIQDILK